MLIFAAAFGALAYVRAYRAYVPMYEARARFTVNSGVASDDIRSSGSSWYDNKAAEELAAAFPNILSTDIMRDLMTEYLRNVLHRRNRVRKVVRGYKPFHAHRQKLIPEERLRCAECGDRMLPEGRGLHGR